MRATGTCVVDIMCVCERWGSEGWRAFFFCPRSSRPLPAVFPVAIPGTTPPFSILLSALLPQCSSPSTYPRLLHVTPHPSFQPPSVFILTLANYFVIQPFRNPKLMPIISTSTTVLHPTVSPPLRSLHSLLPCPPTPFSSPPLPFTLHLVVHALSSSSFPAPSSCHSP